MNSFSIIKCFYVSEYINFSFLDYGLRKSIAAIDFENPIIIVTIAILPNSSSVNNLAKTVKARRLTITFITEFKVIHLTPLTAFFQITQIYPPT